MPESLKHAFELRMRDGVAQGKTLTHGKIVLHSEMWASSLNTHKEEICLAMVIIGKRCTALKSTCRDLHLKSVRPAFSAFLGQH